MGCGLKFLALVWIAICAHQGVATLLEINNRLRASVAGGEDAVQHLNMIEDHLLEIYRMYRSDHTPRLP